MCQGGARRRIAPGLTRGKESLVSGCYVEKSSKARVPQRAVVACLGGTRRRREVRGAVNGEGRRVGALRRDTAHPLPATSPGDLEPRERAETPAVLPAIETRG